MVVLPAVAGVAAALPPGVSQRDELSVGTLPVLLQFDLSPLAANGTVERAVLSLAPHPSWQPADEPVRLFAYAVCSPWSPSSLAWARPVLRAEPAGDVLVPRGARTPVRLDVTSAVRAWQSGTIEPHGLALLASANGAVFAGAGAFAPMDRPRLEVVLR